MRFVFISQMHAQQNAPDRPVSGAFLYWPCGWQHICGRLAAWMSVVVLAHQPQIGRFMQLKPL